MVLDQIQKRVRKHVISGKPTISPILIKHKSRKHEPLIKIDQLESVHKDYNLKKDYMCLNDRYIVEYRSVTSLNHEKIKPKFPKNLKD